MAFGTYKEVVSARATDKAIQKVAQDGGIVSALLCYALEENIIEGAIVAGDTEDAWKPEPTIAMTPEEIIAAELLVKLWDSEKCNPTHLLPDL